MKKTYDQLRQEADRVLAGIASGKIEIRPERGRAAFSLTNSETLKFKQAMGVCMHCNNIAGHSGPCK
jgi:hypothetical protein